jgi:hypothetical protein
MQYLKPSAPAIARYATGAQCTTNPAASGWAELLVRNPRCVFAGTGSDYLIQECDGKDYINKVCDSACQSCRETRTPRSFISPACVCPHLSRLTEFFHCCIILVASYACRNDTDNILKVFEGYCVNPTSAASVVEIFSAVTFAYVLLLNIVW